MAVSVLWAARRGGGGGFQQDRYRPKGVFGKGVGNSKNASEMRQKCVRNASKWVSFYWETRNVQNASEICQNCVKNASKMRGTPLGENTFWTIPTGGLSISARPSPCVLSVPFCYHSSKWHCRQRTISLEIIMHFVADADRDEFFFWN